MERGLRLTTGRGRRAPLRARVRECVLVLCLCAAYGHGEGAEPIAPPPLASGDGRLGEAEGKGGEMTGQCSANEVVRYNFQLTT